MFRRRILLVLIMSAGYSAIVSAVWAERPTESRDDADYVVTGKVTGVYVREDREYVGYVVTLLVDRVERGAALRSGRHFFITCYARKPDAPRVPASGGPRRPPEEGTRIRAYVNDVQGAHEALYPAWFDVLEE